ncbi:MAG TPA: hypothetical protein VNA21_07805 [Steroidobacteraceae bacterium]|nr:hypothetical protein [Steroidobacteraceae bacterium]
MTPDYRANPRHIELAFGEGEFDSSSGRVRFGSLLARSIRY